MLVVAVVLALGTMSPADAAKRKKPANITDVTPERALVYQGADLNFTVFAYAGKKKTVAAPLVFLLSESGDVDDGVQIGGGLLPALRKKARWAQAFSVRIPSTTPDDDYRLLICVASPSLDCDEKISVDVEAVATASSPSPSSPAGSSTTTVPAISSNTKLPSSILNLANWKLTLPIGAGNDPTEIEQPELNSYRHQQWFNANASGTGVVFRANAGGATTSGSSYPRSELREMKPDGTDADTRPDKAAWDPKIGQNVMTVTEAITKLPPNKPHVVAAQIHGSTYDVLQIRLEGTHLFVQIDNTGSNSHVKTTMTNNYVLGTVFTVKITANSAGISVTYNGAPVVTNFLPATYGSNWYFKAGCYLQSNAGYDATSAYGDVVINGLSLQHTS